MVFQKGKVRPRASTSHLDLANLDLKRGEILENLDIVRLVLESVQVALDRLRIVPLRSVEQAVYMPAHVAVPRCRQKRRKNKPAIG